MEEAWSFPSLSSGKTGLQHPQTQHNSEADGQGLAAPPPGPREARVEGSALGPGRAGFSPNGPGLGSR